MLAIMFRCVCVLPSPSLTRVTEMLQHLPYCDGVSWRDETKTIKPIINKAFVASSGDIITGYNDSFGSPNKVVSLSQRNTASPGHGAGSSNNTTATIKITPSFFPYTFGRCNANLPTQWRRHVGGVFKWVILGGRGQVLTFIKNISLGLRL